MPMIWLSFGWMILNACWKRFHETDFRSQGRVEAFAWAAAACLSEAVKAQIEIPGAGILCLCFHLARVHFHPRILQAVTTHLVIAKGTEQDGCSEGREAVEGKA